MDEELHMSVNTGDRIVSIERLSRGDSGADLFCTPYGGRRAFL